MERRNVALRVLYTIDTSPQYILARSAQKVDISLVTPTVSQKENESAIHGRISLRACVDAICRSSPELTPDCSRDYSVYTLDPLENGPPSSSLSSQTSDSGVAVGMGLISSALAVDLNDSVLVTGTLVKDGQGDSALEVVMSLRQVFSPPSYMSQYHYGLSQSPQYHPYQNSHQPLASTSKLKSTRHPSGNQPSAFTSQPLPPLNVQIQSKNGTRSNGCSAENLANTPPSVEVHDVDADSCQGQAPEGSYATAHMNYATRNYGQCTYSSSPADGSLASLFPTIYNGPPRRRPGRPRVGTSDQKSKPRDGLARASKVLGVSKSKEPIPVNGGRNTKEVEQQPSQKDVLHPPDARQCSVQAQSIEAPLPNDTTESNPVTALPDSQLLGTLISALSSSAHNPLILSALSNLSSSSSNSQDSGSNSEPNPMLVQVLMDLLTAAQNPQLAASPPIVIPADEDATTFEVDTSSDLPLTQSHVRARSDKQSMSILDKENVNPRASKTPLSKVSQSSTQVKTAVSTSPLRSGGHNSHTVSRANDSQSGVKERQKNKHAEGANSTAKGKKRTLSTMMEGENSNSKVTATPSVRPRRPWPGDGDGVRVNTGWGGLRLRADGSFSGGHPLKPTAAPAATRPDISTALNPPEPHRLFRSTSSSSLQPRKGPYVVPEWARGVPPPAPPPRSDDSQKVENTSKGKKQDKLKAKSRLGGKATAKVNAKQGAANTEPTIDSPATSPELQTKPNKASNGTSATTAAPSIRPSPVIALTSPAKVVSNKTRIPTALTSPCRPSSVFTIFSSASRPPSTPRSRLVSPPSPTPRATIKGSLFTPSPTLATMNSNGEHVLRSLYAAGSPLFSPSPKRKKIVPVTSPGLKEIKEDDLNNRSRNVTRRTKSELLVPGRDLSEEIATPSSSLPIASDTGSPEDPHDVCGDTSVGPDVTAQCVLDQARDWSSFELPPSSPPPPSSPAFMAVDDEELGTDDFSLDVPVADSEPPDTSYISSDISSWDDQENAFQFYQTSSDFFSDPMSTSFSGNTDFSDMSDIFSDPVLSQLHIPAFSQVEPATEAAVEAIQNGLGDEDFSEVWKLMSSFINHPDADVPGAVTDLMPQGKAGMGGSEGESGLFDFSSFEFDQAMDMEATDSGGKDAVILAAQNIEALLSGCVV